MSVPLAAQYLKHPTPGIPRLPDGKPNLTAPAPRASDGKPDLSGLWRLNPKGNPANLAADLKPSEIQPWAEALYKQRMEDLGKDHMGVLCVPMGPGYITGGVLAKFIQSQGQITILYEDLTYRQVFMDGRELPKDPNPAWMGYSAGHWEGDTLVIESTGFNDRTWLDFGHPHSEELRVTERLRRTDFGHMDMHVTLSDPKIYARPMSLEVEVELAADTELLEYVCAENEKDRLHLVGKLSDEEKNAVKLGPEILLKYAGEYEFRPPEELGLPAMPIKISLVDDALVMEFRGAKYPPLVPLSETSFSGAGGRVEFLKNGLGAVTDLMFRVVEGDFKAPRKQ
jgi:hypothetical protein